MRNQVITFAIALFHMFAYSQSNYTRLDQIMVLEKNGDTLDFPWAGGLNNAQLSNIDLNGDNIDDLFIFDRDGNVIKGFSVADTGLSVSYNYLPTIPEDFPTNMLRFAHLRDYNCDGQMDIITKDLWASIIAFVNDPLPGNAFQQTFLVKTADQFGSYNLGVPGSDISAFDDINNDGYFDVLHFPTSGEGVVEYHLNNSVNKYGTCDSLEFLYQETCWGEFSEAALNCNIQLNSTELLCQTKSNDKPQPKPKLRHAGSTLLTLDLDKDGDKDLLLGDIGCRTLKSLYNLGDSSFATMGAVEPAYPNYDVPVDIEYPAAYYVDINNDNVKDLVVSPNTDQLSNADTAENYHSVWAYINTNKTDSPYFSFYKDNFLQDQMIDVGEGAHPAFGDVDNDGLKDLIIGNYRYYDYSDTLPNESTLNYFKNVGSANNPVFRLQSRNFLGLDSLKLISFKPSFGDLDDDGDEDLIIGTSEGKLLYLRNELNEQFSLQSTFYMGIQVERFATPQLVDFNQDNKLDLIVGEQKGRIHYFENTGSTTVPSFNSAPTIFKFGNIQVMSDTNTGYSVPFLFEDDSANFNLAIGYERGKVLFYEDVSLNSTSILPIDSFNIWSYRTSVDGFDINGDGRKELAIGEYGGGLSIINIGNNVGIDEQIKRNEIKVYPNPTSDFLNIHSDISRAHEIDIFNLTGARVISQNFIGKNSIIDISGLSDGVYILKTGSQAIKIIKK
ncbi:MAG: T9SS type A sorting domain-containing protein [Flavobacteriales bacterium]|nr:T9SS type A sorting domain-containing protein [Flavobacteriales bacterium]